MLQQETNSGVIFGPGGPEKRASLNLSQRKLIWGVVGWTPGVEEWVFWVVLEAFAEFAWVYWSRLSEGSP